MLAVVSWQCLCGMNVKVMYETNRKTKVRCPNSFCKITHTVDGKITELWIKGESAGWRGHEVRSLIVR